MKAKNEMMLIFLADDDQYDCEIFEEALQEFHLNYAIVIFKTGRALLQHLADNKNQLPDLLFLDLNMPEMTGVECLKELRAEVRLQRISIAIYTTSKRNEDIESTLEAGANIFITKTNNFNGLVKILKHVIDINWQYHSSMLNRNTYLLAFN